MEIEEERAVNVVHMVFIEAFDKVLHGGVEQKVKPCGILGKLPD